MARPEGAAAPESLGSVSARLVAAGRDRAKARDPVPRVKTLLAGAALAVVTVAGAAGCSSDGGAAPGGGPAGADAATAAHPNAGLSGPRLRSAFASAVTTGTAVHVAGSVAQGSSPFSLNLNLNKNGETEGEVAQSGATVPVRVVGGVTYIQLTPQFLKLEASSDPAITPSVISEIQNKWVSSRSPVGQSLASGLGSLTNYNSFLGSIASEGASPSASASAKPSASATPSATASGSAGPLDLSSLTPAGTTTLNGQTVAVYRGADGSTAFFAASGPAYLEKVVAKGSDAGTLTFTWNQPATVSAPPSSDIFNG